MSAFTVEHQVQVPEGTLLRAKLVELEVREIPRRDPKPGEDTHFKKLAWHFEITQQGEFMSEKVRGETSAYLSDHPDNKFRTFAEALLGRPLDLGQQLFPSDLEGLQALITVRYEPDRKDPSKKYRRVDDVIALEGGGHSANDEPPF